MPANTLSRPRCACASALALALSLCMLALLLLLLAPSAALAKARGTACRPVPVRVHSKGAHARRSRHGCASRLKKHSRRRHAAGRRAAKAKRKADGDGSANPLPGSSEAIAASCEDDSAPLQVEPEVYECADGSEPGCDDGSDLTISSDGSQLLCTGSPPTGGDSIETECVASLAPTEDHEGAAGEAVSECSTGPDALEPDAEAEDEGAEAED